MLTRAALVRRPAALAVAVSTALAALLAGGTLVARAVEGETVPVATAATSPSPEATVQAQSAEPDAAADQPSTSQGDDNVAAAVNTKDGSTVYAIRLRVVQTSADVVDAGNAAVAVASCENCTTVAIALEGVLVTGDAESIVPVNLALAYNQDCSSCQTLAYAYQKVMSTDGRVRLTGEGRRQIAALRVELQGLRQADLTLDEIRAVVRRVAQDFATVLETQTRPVGKDRTAATADGATGTPEVSPTEQPSGQEPEPTAGNDGDAGAGSPEPSVAPEPDSPPAAG